MFVIPELEGGSADFVHRLWELRRTSSGPSSSPSKAGPRRRHLRNEFDENNSRNVFHEMVIVRRGFKYTKQIKPIYKYKTNLIWGKLEIQMKFSSICLS